MIPCDLREAFERVADKAARAARTQPAGNVIRREIMALADRALSAQPRPEAVEAVIGGTALCGHGVMASICDKCADEGKESEGGIMAAARKAQQRVETWSDAKKDYAERTVGSPSDPTPPDAAREAVALWPNGCRNPNSCSIHRDCMYLQCKHYERDISGEVDAALQTRALSERKDRE